MSASSGLSGYATQSLPSVTESARITPPIAATAPGQVRVIKRNGAVVPYTDEKIEIAMTKAFLAVEGNVAAASSRIRERVAELTGQVSAVFRRRFPSGGTIHIEDIQDQVELALMRGGEHISERTRRYCGMPASKCGSWT